MEAHPAGNTTQAHRAWSQSAPAGTPQETTQGLWRGAGHLPAHQVGTPTPDGSFCSLRPTGWPGTTTEEGFCVLQHSLMASEGLLPVNLVTLPFRAAMTL